MATIKGLWELNDSLMTSNVLPIGYNNTININGRVFKSGSWNNFTQIAVKEESQYEGWKNNITPITEDGQDIYLIDYNFNWWGGFEYDRIIDFGEEPQEMDDIIYNFITTNATQVEFDDVFVTLNGNFKWKSVLADGSYFNGVALYIKGTTMQPEDGIYDGFVFMIPDEDTANEFGLTPGVWGLARATVNTDTEEQFLQTYQNGVWSSEEARSFTLDNKTLSKSLATYILTNTESTVSKGPNYTALKNALDRLAVAIKNNIGGEAIYPFTIEEMCRIADGTMPVANEGEKGKEGFFYYMGKMAYCIAERCGVESPLTIEEMIEALGKMEMITFTINPYGIRQAEADMTWYEWVNSSYGGGNGYSWSCGSITDNVKSTANGGKVQHNGANVIGSDKIIANATYTVFIDNSEFEY